MNLSAADPERAIEIAPRIWWVGHALPDDPFQCHTYLIEHGDQSVLIDPGSRLTVEHTLRKVEQLIPLCHVRYLVCHHQDPDVSGALPRLAEVVTREDARIICHWRAATLLKHYGPRQSFYLVDQHDWLLDLGGRVIEFVFTPYLHFAGAICTYDRQSGTLFSSDLFGGFTDGWSLVADEGYFEAIRTFHEHYMPSRDVLLSGLERIEALPLQLIAPQHGSLIPAPMIPPIIEQLKRIDCGIYLLAGTREDTDIARLSRVNRRLRDVITTLTVYRAFEEVAAALLALARELMQVEALEFFACAADREVFYLGPCTRYQAVQVTEPPRFCQDLLATSRAQLERKLGDSPIQLHVPAMEDTADDQAPQPSILLPLIPPDKDWVNGLAVIRLARGGVVPRELTRLLKQITTPLEVALERERIYRLLEQERQQLYEHATRDALTGLYTRRYMEESVQRLMSRHDRDGDAAVALVVFDVDHFKTVNDTLGHVAGDHVLREVGRIMRQHVRGGDVAVRLGGEEFAIFLTGRDSAPHASTIAERVRDAVSKVEVDGCRLTISAGVAVRRQRETLEELLRRSDGALYRAKRGGRNRVCLD